VLALVNSTTRGIALPSRLEAGPWTLFASRSDERALTGVGALDTFLSFFRSHSVVAAAVAVAVVVAVAVAVAVVVAAAVAAAVAGHLRVTVRIFALSRTVHSVSVITAPPVFQLGSIRTRFTVFEDVRTECFFLCFVDSFVLLSLLATTSSSTASPASTTASVLFGQFPFLRVSGRNQFVLQVGNRLLDRPVLCSKVDVSFEF